MGGFGVHVALCPCVTRHLLCRQEFRSITSPEQLRTDLDTVRWVCLFCGRGVVRMLHAVVVLCCVDARHVLGACLGDVGLVWICSTLPNCAVPKWRSRWLDLRKWPWRGGLTPYQH